MRIFTHLLIVFALVVSVAACKPKNFAQFPETPDGPPEYKQAWEDGCESGLSTYGNSFYKTFYSYKMDPNLRDNDIYYRTWNDSFHYCRSWAKTELALGLSPSDGFGINDNVLGDMRDPRTVTQSGFTLPLWGSMGGTGSMTTFGSNADAKDLYGNTPTDAYGNKAGTWY